MKADVARILEAAEAIAALEGVSEVYSVTGQIDLIALIRVRQQEDVAPVVADRLNKVPGIISTETHIAFRTLLPARPRVRVLARARLSEPPL